MAFSQGPTITGTVTALGTVSVENYNKMIVQLGMSATTETVNMTASVDGVTFTTAKLRPIDLSTGAVYASGDIKAGIFSVVTEGIRSVKFTKSSTSETATILIGFSK